MAHTQKFDDDIPEPPRLRPTWMTWVWLVFGVLVMVLTIAGLWSAGR